MKNLWFVYYGNYVVKSSIPLRVRLGCIEEDRAIINSFLALGFKIQ